MSRASKVVTGVAVAGVAGVAGLVVTQQIQRPQGPPTPVSVTTGTAVVTRTTISERQFVAGTLGYVGSFSIIGASGGTLTWLAPVSTVVERGGALYEADGRRVTLMYGSRPVWRDLASGVTDGIDVEQLETNLRDLGFGQGLTVDRKFTSATARAIRRWQSAAHLPVTGTVPTGQVAFMPGAVRISGHQLTPGAQLTPGGVVANATSTEPAVNVNASTQQLGWIKVDTPVTVTLPDGKTRTGKVTTIGATTTTTSTAANGNNGGAAGGTTAAVTVRLDGDATGFVDQATVQVWVIRATHPNVLTVPIPALNSTVAGSYEVITTDGVTTRRVPVKTGLFDDLSGTAEVSAEGLAEGQKVQVPRDNA
jgi:peptidoglycan hydrolase-like protein with peptidoglycan-binding domain